MTSFSERYGYSGKVNRYTCNGDKVLSKKTETENFHSFKHFLRSVFLPQGFPLSVSEDYFEYQVWDTLQAFSSSITGALATQAVLKGVGVGNAEASIMAATITWLLKDGTGMIGRICFAWMRGSHLDSDCKKWRMYADILNDTAILLDILSPFFASIFTFIVCISGVMRAVVCVAGGATRTAITQHQARRNNLADVSAKDGSQETLVNLVGLIVSLVVIPLVTGNTFFIWTLFFMFTLIHLYGNYRAVTCLVMETFNQSRFSIVVSSHVLNGVLPSIRETNMREPVILGSLSSFKINLGCSYEKLLPHEKRACSRGDSPTHYSEEAYILNINFDRREINICLKNQANYMDQLKACYEAELLKLCLQTPEDETFQESYKHLETFKKLLSRPSKNDIKDLLISTHKVVNDTWPDFVLLLEKTGWNLEYVMLNADEWRIQ